MRTRFITSGVAAAAALLVAASAMTPALASTVDPAEPSTVVETPAAEPSTETTAPEPAVPAAPADEREPGTSSSGVVVPTASVDDGGLRLMHAFTGNLNWSVDGLGINPPEQTGTLTVQKPAGAAVIRAYLMLASFSEVDVADLSDVRLNGAAPSFTEVATDTLGFGFRNFMADVTSIVRPTIDGASAGNVAIAINEGANAGQIEGSSLVVVFDDPAVSISSIAIYFGTSVTTGDNFTLAFDTLSEPQTQDLRMSLGSAFSYGEGQSTVVSVNGQTLSDVAGHFDDCDAFVAGDEDGGNWTCEDGALITVGGVGESLTNPVVGEPWTTVNDDELYSLSPFVEVGDTQIEVQTLNDSGDDNVFMAVFYLDEIELEGAERVSAELAETGASETAGLLGAGMLALIVGAAALIVSRRRTATAQA
ncbi:MAG: LPXTG cell wall anchor domain-containing protein [Microcella sp.]